MDCSEELSSGTEPLSVRLGPPLPESVPMMISTAATSCIGPPVSKISSRLRPCSTREKSLISAQARLHTGREQRPNPTQSLGATEGRRRAYNKKARSECKGSVPQGTPRADRTWTCHARHSSRSTACSACASLSLPPRPRAAGVAAHQKKASPPRPRCSAAHQPWVLTTLLVHDEMRRRQRGGAVKNRARERLWQLVDHAYR
eukprot:COSAG03_NODE_5635_length_1205_cov_0.871609_2_plen_201_part_01